MLRPCAAFAASTFCNGALAAEEFNHYNSRSLDMPRRPESYNEDVTLLRH